jgi:hypothetical protein
MTPRFLFAAVSGLALLPFRIQLGSHSVAPLTSATAVTVARKWKFTLSN